MVVRRVAAHLRRRRRVPQRRLYRGILVEPEIVSDGKLHPEPHIQFVSWTESLDVACWFADLQSQMSLYLKQQRPRAQGFIITTTSPADVLFYYKWARNFEIAGRTFDLAQFAFTHPDMGQVGYSQIQWAIDTQYEVITEKTDSAFDVVPVGNFQCPSTEQLDNRLTWPSAVRFG